jgi:hypothetical protein
MKSVRVFSILLAAAANFSGVDGQIIEVSEYNFKPFSMRKPVPIIIKCQQLPYLFLFRSSRSLQREGSGVPSRKTTEAQADEARKRVSLLSPTDNLRIVTKKTNHWSVNYRALTSTEQHTKWFEWRTIQRTGLAETNSKVVKAHSSLPPVLKSMMTQTSSSFPLDQPFR